MILTERDRQILEAIYFHEGQLTGSQIGRLFFAKASGDLVASRTVRERLSLLVSAKYLARGKFEQMIYWLGELGATYLSQVVGREIKSKSPNQAVLAHNVKLNNWRLAIGESAHGCGAEIETWVSSSEFWAKPDRIHVNGLARYAKPDGYCSLVGPKQGERRRFRLLLELDIGTMSNARFVQEKVQTTIAYLRSETYKQRFGQSGVCVTATSNQVKLDNLRREVGKAALEYSDWFYFTTIEQAIKADVLTASIWTTPNNVTPFSILGD